MGSGKTMYLKANYAYYLYTLIPCLLDSDEIILPIYLRLSDFQHIEDSKDLYKNIIIKLISEMAGVYSHLQDSKKMEELHRGIDTLDSSTFFKSQSQMRIINELKKISAEEYVEKTSKAFTNKGSAGFDVIQLSAEYYSSFELELRKKPNPGIEDFINAYNTLLKPIDGKLLILVDEIGSINRSFFKKNGEISVFETLMNQLRTQNYIRTKIAVYPQTYSDILTETRYGDVIQLEEDVFSNKGYQIFLNKGISLIEKYIENFSGHAYQIENVFDTQNSNLQTIEQIVYASDGNMRRFVQLLDLAMSVSYKENTGNERVNIIHCNEALKENARSMEKLFSEPDIDFLDILVKACKSRATYRFKFPLRSLDIKKYTNKSEESNIIKLIEPGTGRRSSVYSFDYAYAVYKDIPTHNIKNTDRLDKTRSFMEGEWIKRITTINDELIEHVQIAGKIEGEVRYISKDNSGFVESGGKDYFFQESDIIVGDKNKIILVKTRLRFLPVPIGETMYARYVEVLK